VEHPCYQCKATVEEGIPFCPHCNAPQIRVFGGGVPESGTLEPAFSGVQHPESQSHIHTSAVTGMVWPQALPAAIQAGLIGAFLMIIPVAASFGLGMFSAGFLAVLFYQRRVFNAPLTSGLGARLGALSGMFGFGIFGVLTAIETLVFHSGGELRQALIQAVEQAAARNSDPQAQQMLQYLRSPQGLALVMIFGLLFMFLLFVVLSSLGGVLGSAMLRRKQRS
jgi:hypothetical protein